MNRRSLLQSVGLLGAGISTGATIDKDLSFSSSEPVVIFEGGKDKFSLVENESDATQANSMLNGNAILENKTNNGIDGEFQTYFIGELDGENYGFQASAEVQSFDAKEKNEVSISTEFNSDFKLREYLVVFVQER